MGLIDNARRAALTLMGVTPVQKATGPMGQAMQAANLSQGMGGTTPLGPGTPLDPAWGYNQTPRRSDYMPGRNITIRPRSDERISFATLRDFVDSYDVAQACITHRIDSIRSLPWDVVPMDGVTSDQTRPIQIARKILAKPDGRTPFATFLNEYLWDLLAYDAGCLYKVQNNAGQTIGLKPIDGTTIAPLLDRWGDTPNQPDPETGQLPAAYVQIIHGIPVEWYDVDRLVYEPFRKRTNSPYGRAALEAIIVNASADIKLQLHFLKNYTAGNIPAMFGVLPAEMNAQQRQDWQDSWDALIKADEDAKSQIHWVPGGTNFHDITKKDFDKDLAEWFLRKTCAAYHVSPQELGYVTDVNRSNGETQENVQQRVGDLPLIEHVEGILTRFLQEDLGAALEFKFDRGGEEEDRLQTAQSDKIYMDAGVVSVSEIREIRFGKTDEDIVPRFVFSTRDGAVPLSSLFVASSPVMADSGEPDVGQLAPAQQTNVQAIQPTIQATKPGATGATVADEAPNQAPANIVAKAAEHETEKRAFAAFVKARRRRGTWRDFTFTTADDRSAAELNKLGRALIRKDAGQIGVAGLLIHAEDTDRVLMLQRALDPTDPAQGKWEFPGGHLEAGETPQAAALREWSEEVGVDVPDGQLGGTWTNGFYQGFVLHVPSEASVPCRIGSTTVLNPDDPDGDGVETVAWWDQQLLAANPAIRAEVLASLPAVYAAIHDVDGGDDGPGDGDAPPPEDGPTPYTVEEMRTLGQEVLAAHDGDLAAALGDDAAPLVKGWRDGQPLTPMHHYDLAIIDHYQPMIAAALTAWVNDLPVKAVAESFAPRFDALRKDDDEDAEYMAEALRAGKPLDIQGLLRGIAADGYSTGAHAAVTQLDGAAAAAGVDTWIDSVNLDWSTWTPGDPAAAAAVADGGLTGLLDAAGITIRSVEDSLYVRLGNILAESLLAGNAPADIASSISDLVDVPGRSTMIAVTETARAQIAGAQTTYGEYGIQQVDVLLAAGACAICQAAADANPHPLGDGNLPPLHPYCRCSITPVTETITIT